MSFGDKGLPRFIDPDYREASVTDGQSLVLNPSQIHANVDEILERHLLDPTVIFGLQDFFGDAETAFVFAQLGLAEDLAQHIAKTASKLIRQSFPNLYGQVDWAFLTNLDPGLPDGQIADAELLLARQIMRDAFDPNRSVAESYGVADLPYQGQTGLWLVECAFFALIGQGLREGPGK